MNKYLKRTRRQYSNDVDSYDDVDSYEMGYNDIEAQPSAAAKFKQRGALAGEVVKTNTINSLAKIKTMLVSYAAAQKEKQADEVSSSRDASRMRLTSGSRDASRSAPRRYTSGLSSEEEQWTRTSPVHSNDSGRSSSRSPRQARSVPRLTQQPRVTTIKLEPGERELPSGSHRSLSSSGTSRSGSLASMCPVEPATRQDISSPNCDVYLILAVTNLIGITSLATTTSSAPRSTNENGVLALGAICFFVTLFVGLGCRFYAPFRTCLSKTSSRRPIARKKWSCISELGGSEDDILDTPDTRTLPSTSCMSIEQVLLNLVFLFTCIKSGLVLHPSNGMALSSSMGSTQVWNSNLFYSTWISLYGVAYLMVDTFLASGDEKRGRIGQFLKLHVLSIFSSIVTCIVLLVTYTGVVCEGDVLTKTSYCTSALGGGLIAFFGALLCCGVTAFLLSDRSRHEMTKYINLGSSTLLFALYTTMIVIVSSPGGSGSVVGSEFISSWMAWIVGTVHWKVSIEVVVAPKASTSTAFKPTNLKLMREQRSKALFNASRHSGMTTTSTDSSQGNDEVKVSVYEDSDSESSFSFRPTTRPTTRRCAAPSPPQEERQYRAGPFSIGNESSGSESSFSFRPSQKRELYQGGQDPDEEVANSVSYTSPKCGLSQSSPSYCASQATVHEPKSSYSSPKTTSPHSIRHEPQYEPKVVPQVKPRQAPQEAVNEAETDCSGNSSYCSSSHYSQDGPEDGDSGEETDYSYYSGSHAVNIRTGLQEDVSTLGGGTMYTRSTLGGGTLFSKKSRPSVGQRVQQANHKDPPRAATNALYQNHSRSREPSVQDSISSMASSTASTLSMSRGATAPGPQGQQSPRVPPPSFHSAPAPQRQLSPVREANNESMSTKSSHMSGITTLSDGDLSGLTTISGTPYTARPRASQSVVSGISTLSGSSISGASAMSSVMESVTRSSGNKSQSQPSRKTPPPPPPRPLPRHLKRPQGDTPSPPSRGYRILKGGIISNSRSSGESTPTPVTNHTKTGSTPTTKRLSPASPSTKSVKTDSSSSDFDIVLGDENSVITELTSDEFNGGATLQKMGSRLSMAVAAANTAAAVKAAEADACKQQNTSSSSTRRTNIPGLPRRMPLYNRSDASSSQHTNELSERTQSPTGSRVKEQAERQRTASVESVLAYSAMQHGVSVTFPMENSHEEQPVVPTPQRQASTYSKHTVNTRDSIQSCYSEENTFVSYTGDFAC